MEERALVSSFAYTAVKWVLNHPSHDKHITDIPSEALWQSKVHEFVPVTETAVVTPS